MSTANERELLRQALQQAADGVEPRADGLQRIQANLRPPRPLVVAWAEAAWTFLRMRVPAALEEFMELLRGLASLAWERFGPSRGGSAGRTSRTFGWLRPAAALAVTVFIVAGGTYIAINSQQGISNSASNALRSTGPGGGGSPGSNGGTARPGQSASGPGSSTRPTPKATCRPARSSSTTPSTSGSTGPNQSSSPSPSPTSTSGGVSPSPTPTGSSTATPATSIGTQATLTIQSVLAQSSTTSSGLPICGKKHAPRNPSGATTAVFSYGKLDGGS